MSNLVSLFKGSLKYYLFLEKEQVYLKSFIFTEIFYQCILEDVRKI